MAYLQPTDYTNYGLPSGTSADWITAATALINSYCRRPDINVMQYIERLRITQGAQTVYLSFLPLTVLGTATSPIVSLEGRYGRPRRGEFAQGYLGEIALAFSLPGQWVSIDTSLIDFNPATGELDLPRNLIGLPFDEVKVTYTAGLATIGDDIKTACAQIVRNAQATPALNASQTRIDTMWIRYFSSSLIDDTVKEWLSPYVANKLG